MRHQKAATDVDYYTDNQSPPVYTENLYFKEKKMNWKDRIFIWYLYEVLTSLERFCFACRRRLIWQKLTFCTLYWQLNCLYTIATLTNNDIFFSYPGPRLWYGLFYRFVHYFVIQEINLNISINLLLNDNCSWQTYPKTVWFQCVSCRIRCLSQTKEIVKILRRSAIGNGLNPLNFTTASIPPKFRDKVLWNQILQFNLIGVSLKYGIRLLLYNIGSTTWLYELR